MTAADLPPAADLREPIRLSTSFAGTVHWVSEFTGPDRGDGRTRRAVQISDVLDSVQLDAEEARSLHTWLGVFVGRLDAG